MTLKRRDFFKTAAAISAPMIVPASVFGSSAPSNKIHVAQIGCGRIARGHDLPETWKCDEARIVAACDVDTKRANEGKELIEKYYMEKRGIANYQVKTYQDYREMLLDPNIDAVIISTPDHWHSQPAMEAALAGKDIYLQKPTSLTIKEGRQLSDAVHKTGRILQLGSQQRSMSPWPQFKIACELVRNGRIGKIKTIKVGLPGDPPGGSTKKMEAPENLDYDMWLGSTPYVYYTEQRVHPKEGYGRPGWLRCEQFGAGMITGWGAHHIDTAHWGMGTEYTGPIEIEGHAEFPTKGLWNVHGSYNIEAKYANGVIMQLGGDNPNGVRFEGEDGWIWVTRGNISVTASDPTSAEKSKKALDASDPKILKSVIGENEIHLHRASEQHTDWINSIKTRKAPVAPVEVGHRSCSACLLSHIAMKIPRKLYWDPGKERFKNDDEANAMLSRPQRFPWGSDFV